MCDVRDKQRSFGTKDDNSNGSVFVFLRAQEEILFYKLHLTSLCVKNWQLLYIISTYLSRQKT